MSKEKLDYASKEAPVVADSDVDSEAHVAMQEGHTLHRTMKNRHIAMIRYAVHICLRNFTDGIR